MLAVVGEITFCARIWNKKAKLLEPRLIARIPAIARLVKGAAGITSKNSMSIPGIIKAHIDCKELNAIDERIFVEIIAK